jgi:hypothetical protein
MPAKDAVEKARGQVAGFGDFPFRKMFFAV